MSRTELHIHSTFSDGEETPEEIVRNAKKADIEVLSFTDHDEIGAYKAVRELAKEQGIHLIPGIELNTDGVDGELHILGYFFNPDHPKMNQHIVWRKQERKIWAIKIIEKLNELGYDITFEDAMKHAGGEIIVRTHIAKALLEKKYFDSAETAYHELLVKGKLAFIERAPFSAEDAIKLIQDSGGKAFLAHPAAYTFKVNKENLLSYGLDGIEVYHSKHEQLDVVYWKEFAEKNGLLVSGGSDNHGPDSRNPFLIGSIQLDKETKKKWLRKVGLK